MTSFRVALLISINIASVPSVFHQTDTFGAKGF